MWAEADRPREKMMLKGRNALSDAELLAILIGTGSGHKSAVDLGRELLANVEGDLNRLSKLSVQQLCQVKGIGTSKAVSLLAAIELGRRRKQIEFDEEQVMKNGFRVYQLLRPYFADLQHEEFYIVLLKRNNEVLSIKQLSVGGTTGTIVDAKIVFRNAMECGASGIILAHNHPSGNKQPSSEDISLTRKLRSFGEMIDMPILDHLIVADNGYFSFADEGLML